ncbi:hypothetical protein SAMN04488689_105126 [Paenibacillus sp. cl6col]|nr:hypothetical protein SAMN04488689_105126 [Paenibacillus sp. cl6col]
MGSFILVRQALNRIRSIWNFPVEVELERPLKFIFYQYQEKKNIQ